MYRPTDSQQDLWEPERILPASIVRRLRDNWALDMRWQHALMPTPDKAYLNRRSLVAFRSRLTKMDEHAIGARKLFDEVAQAAIKDLGISTDEQRTDSTLFSSNIQPGQSVDDSSTETSTEPVKEEVRDPSSGQDDSSEDNPGGSAVEPDKGDDEAETESNGPR